MTDSQRIGDLARISHAYREIAALNAGCYEARCQVPVAFFSRGNAGGGARQRRLESYRKHSSFEGLCWDWGNKSLTFYALFFGRKALQPTFLETFPARNVKVARPSV